MHAGWRPGAPCPRPSCTCRGYILNTQLHRLLRILAFGALGSAGAITQIASAQPSLYEVEPNNTPAEATPISGATTLIGTMDDSDQDGFKWTVSDVDARKRWSFELQGIPGRLTIVEVLRIDYAENGVDVTGKRTLFKLGSRDGSTPVVQQNLLFEPGDYLLGVASAGGGGVYRPPAATLDFGGSSTASEADQTAGGYRLAIRQGDELHPEDKPAERATRETARELRLGDEHSAYLTSEHSWYAFKLDEKDAARHWAVDAQVPIGRKASMTLYGGDDTQLATTASGTDGKLHFRDLGLAAGSYRIEISGADSGYIQVLATSASGQRVEGEEAEPNDQWTLANHVDLAQPVSGRMGVSHENDLFTFTLDEATADQVLVLGLATAAEAEFELCLLNADGKQVQCRNGKGAIELPDLVLLPGEWGFKVGRGAENAQYTVTLSATGAIKRGVETEPNDSVEYASAMPANNRVKARFSGDESDFYRFLIADEPQLWRFQVVGEGIHEFALYDGAGVQNQVYRVPADQRRVRLDNVFLLPGIHQVRVTGRDGGNYTLLARPIGPPDPDGEFEPNDDDTRMQPLRFGQTRNGLLEDSQDQDRYRFYLGNRDRIRLTIEPPADGSIKADLNWGGSNLKEVNNVQPGQKLVLEGLFPPGNYQLSLSARQTSETPYKLSLERLPRFGCPVDCEPNDNVDFASPFPDSHVIEGRVNEWRDADWYQLPVFEQATDVTVTAQVRERIRIVSRAYGAKDILTWDNENKLWRGVIPAGEQHYLQVEGGDNAPYSLKVDFSNRPGADSPPTGQTVTMALALDPGEVSAYRQFAQQLSGSLRLHNSGSAPVDVTLQTATSDYRWGVELDAGSVSIAAGGETSIPVRIEVPADAWADWPVRISALAVDTGGARSETFVEVSAGREAAPADPRAGWQLPAALRGGFNVAWNALGGRWAGTEDDAIGSGFAELFDGIAVENAGLQLRGGTQQRTVDVVTELAGSEPVEVAGIALNLLGNGNQMRLLRNVDLALSLDGEHFEPVLTDELLPVKTEQAFVLAEPVLARFARLQLKHGYDGSAATPISLGEFKVIARPGTDISGGAGFNLADPGLGGHVVWSKPPISASNWDDNLLQDKGKWDQVRLRSAATQDFVIGFHHDRAAQINRIEWVDADAADASARFQRVKLAASIDSPFGPWQEIGEWELSAARSSQDYLLDKPVWARFVRFSASTEAEQDTLHLPAMIRIWEKPVADDYRSILGEWGFASQQGIYEALHPLPLEKPFKPLGNESRKTALPLKPGETAQGQVVLGKHQHWYKLTAPADANTFTFSLQGDPSVRTVLQLEDSAGKAVVLRRDTSKSTSQIHVMEAIVEPGGDYYLQVDEPPRNVVFSWDTSASVGAYLPVIYSSLIAYSEDLVPGRDAANLMPFGGDTLLRDWYGEPYILQTVLNDYPRKESSSEAEKTLATASRALAPRAGTKAIVLITDAATNRYPAMWDDFRTARPRIFTLALGSQGAFGRQPKREQDLMQDWSRVNSGYYSYLLDEGEMEVAFDRAATMMRRPASYSLSLASGFTETPGPGSLRLVAGTGTPLQDGAVELILDASGSMLKRLDGKRRIAIAKEVLTEAVRQHIPAGTPVALRVFGHKEANSCRTDLEIPMQPLQPAAAAKTIASVNAMNLAKTPIADSLASVESDLRSSKGRKIVVLVTDGEETCEGDPEAVIRKLQEKGVDLTMNIVGFAIDNAALEEQFQAWAELAGGRYLSASSQAGLSASLNQALQVPFTVYDATGEVAGQGVVGGEPLELARGQYRVVVKTSPAQTFPAVEISGEQQTLLELQQAGKP
jgi:hypothetical protein